MFTNLIEFDGMVWYPNAPQCRAYTLETGVSLHSYRSGKKQGGVWFVKLNTVKTQRERLKKVQKGF